MHQALAQAEYGPMNPDVATTPDRFDTIRALAETALEQADAGDEEGVTLSLAEIHRLASLPTAE